RRGGGDSGHRCGSTCRHPGGRRRDAASTAGARRPGGVCAALIGSQHRTRVGFEAMGLRRREALRILAACMADWWLPRRALALSQQRSSSKPERRVIVVTFGGGVRYEDTLAREGWVNIPHLASELVPQGLVYPVAR